MNMQEIEENNKAQVKAQKADVQRFLYALKLLTAQYNIEILAPGGFMLIESSAPANQPCLTQWASGIQYHRFRSGTEGYVVKEWHPDLMENKEGE